MAANRSRWVSKALYTIPIPPSPIFSRTLYCRRVRRVTRFAFSILLLLSAYHTLRGRPTEGISSDLNLQLEPAGLTQIVLLISLNSGCFSRVEPFPIRRCGYPYI